MHFAEANPFVNTLSPSVTVDDIQSEGFVRFRFDQLKQHPSGNTLAPVCLVGSYTFKIERIIVDVQWLPVFFAKTEITDNSPEKSKISQDILFVDFQRTTLVGSTAHHRDPALPVHRN